nr:putative reverse transcriptase domain-containing protein [Tanacetum cinerariifolium]
CFGKIVRIPLEGGETLVVKGDKLDKDVKVKRIQDNSVVQNHPKVFPEYLPRLHPPRQVEFQIDLVSRATPVAKAPYRLASSEMRELSGKLQDLLSKGLIRPGSSP